MFWYKHSTGSHDDPDISDAMDEFGHSGYAVFFIILEIYGDEYNHLDSGGWLTLSRRFIARKLRLSQAKVELILNFYSERQRILIKTSKNTISINCPKFVEIASNWTKRKKSIPTEVLQSPSVVPTAKEEEEKKKRRRREEEVEQRFKIFWESYPKRKSKGQAEKAFLKINPDEQLLETIVSKIEQAKTSEDWLKEKGKYIPYPATWLNAKGWEDELIINTNNKPTTPKDNFTDCKSCGKRTYKPDLNADGLCIKCENAANTQGVANA